MEKSQKIVQVYGYTVCLVALITFIITVTTLVNAMLDKSDPLHYGWTSPEAPSLASYENYKMDVLKSGKNSNDATRAQSYVPDENTIRKMYDSAKQDKIDSALHDINKTTIVSSLVLILSIAIFLTHWFWMKKIRKES